MDRLRVVGSKLLDGPRVVVTDGHPSAAAHTAVVCTAAKAQARAVDTRTEMLALAADISTEVPVADMGMEVRAADGKSRAVMVDGNKMLAGHREEDGDSRDGTSTNQSPSPSSNTSRFPCLSHTP